MEREWNDHQILKDAAEGAHSVFCNVYARFILFFIANGTHRFL